MRNFDSIESIFEYIQNECEKLVQNEILYETKSVMCETIQEVVYDAYIPNMYQRRYEQGGLVDRDNIIINEIKKDSRRLTANIINDTPRNNEFVSFDDPRTLDEIIEYGVRHDVLAEPYQLPRPFIQETTNKLIKDEVVEKIIEDHFK